jgi:hypothetical protein
MVSLVTMERKRCSILRCIEIVLDPDVITHLFYTVVNRKLSITIIL